MRLNHIADNKKAILYKGISTYGGLGNWPVKEEGENGSAIPGFLGSYETAIVYSEPNLTGRSTDPSMIVKFSIDLLLIEDRTIEYLRWAEKNLKGDPDISSGFPNKWREDDSIWTVRDSGSAHSSKIASKDFTFIYAGAELNYTVVHFFANQAEWEELEK